MEEHMRLLTVAASVAVTALTVVGGLQAQAAVHTPDTTKVDRAQFTGTIAGIDQGMHQLLIDAVRTPGPGLAMSLPYEVAPAELAKYHVGERVVGEVITSRHRAYVMNVREARGPKDHIVERRAKSPKPEVERWAFVGRVAGVDANANQLLIEAERVPGKGPAMTVPYQAASAKELNRYKVGDQVRGEIVISRERTYVQKVRPAPAG
jgi:hypothetical protein